MMTTTGSRNWRPGPRRDETRPRRAPASTGKDAKLLARAGEALAESERRVSRQIAVLADLRAAGLVTNEAEKSLMRLEAAVLEQRSSREMLLTTEKDGAAPG